MLKLFRVAAGLSQHGLIKKLHYQGVKISQSGLSMWELGHRKPSKKAIRALSKILKVKEELLS